MVGCKDYHYHFHYPGWLFRVGGEVGVGSTKLNHSTNLQQFPLSWEGFHPLIDLWLVWIRPTRLALANVWLFTAETWPEQDKQTGLLLHAAGIRLLNYQHLLLVLGFPNEPGWRGSFQAATRTLLRSNADGGWAPELHRILLEKRPPGTGTFW